MSNPDPQVKDASPLAVQLDAFIMAEKADLVIIGSKSLSMVSSMRSRALPPSSRDGVAEGVADTVAQGTAGVAFCHNHLMHCGISRYS